jgi:hypothetical protein
MIILSEAPGLVATGLPIIDAAGQNGVLLCTDREVAVCCDPDGKIYRVPLDKIGPDFYEPVAVAMVAMWCVRLASEYSLHDETYLPPIYSDEWQDRHWVQEGAEAIHAAFWQAKGAE